MPIAFPGSDYMTSRIIFLRFSRLYHGKLAEDVLASPRDKRSAVLEAPRAVSEWYVHCTQAQPALSFMKLSSLGPWFWLIEALLFTEFSVTDQRGA